MVFSLMRWRPRRAPILLFFLLVVTLTAHGGGKPPVLVGLGAISHGSVTGGNFDGQAGSALPIETAGSAERPAVRNALEQLLIARFRPDGVLVPAGK